MNAKINDLIFKRNNLVAQSRALITAADAEKRQLNDDEQSQWDKMYGDVGKINDQIQTEQRQLDMDRIVAEGVTAATQAPETVEDRNLPVTATKEYRAACSALIAGGKQVLTPEQARALSAGVGTEGGFTLMPQDMVSMLLKAIDNEVFILDLATVHPVASAASLGLVSLDADPDDAEWTGEISTGANADSTMAFGKREFHPNALAKRIKISNKLLNMSPDKLALVIARLAYKFAITQEKGFMTGDGVKKALGVFVASANGISTARDVATGNTSTAMTMDGLINAKYALKGGYLRKAHWIFHRDGIKQIAKMREDTGGAGTGGYIWEPSKKLDEPDMLLSRPLKMSEYAPNTFTSGLYTGILGDFSYYWVARALDMQFQVLKELYAETNQTGVIGRMEVDGMPVLGEAFVRVKLG